MSSVGNVANLDKSHIEDKTGQADFKMVAFSLGGDDFAIDIMKVKEIAKKGCFTYVPNTASFVIGVYNLRGDIIPIIDFRTFFNIPVPEREGNEVENVIIVMVNGQTFGIVVDAIDKVMGVSSALIQKPHPYFSQINVKYIQGIIETGKNLHILLDLDNIFSVKSVSEEFALMESKNALSSASSASSFSTTPLSAPPEAVTPAVEPSISPPVLVADPLPPPEIPPVVEVARSSTVDIVAEKPADFVENPLPVVESPPPVIEDKTEAFVAPVEEPTPVVQPPVVEEIAVNPPMPQAAVVAEPPAVLAQSEDDEEKPISYDNIIVPLKEHLKFVVSKSNISWVKHRFKNWKTSTKEKIESHADAEDFLQPFYSKYTGAFWSEDYADAVMQALPELDASQITVWNPGCGKGFESYSLACVLKKRYPDTRIRIYAQDIDLLSISGAPTIIVSQEQSQQWFFENLILTASEELTFSSEIKDMILFEYHDCLHVNNMPTVDIIFSRDVVSFLEESAQATLFTEFSEKLKSAGVLILGDNETPITDNAWSEQMVADIVVYKKE
ncbi:MAG: CheR family methyltransferase [Treponemataceae bacterium]